MWLMWHTLRSARGGVHTRAPAAGACVCLAALQLEERVAQLTVQLAEVQKEAQGELARVKAQAAADLAAAAGRTAACSETTASADGAQQQKVQLERSLAQLSAALTTKQKEMDARVRCVAELAWCSLGVCEAPHTAKHTVLVQICSRHAESLLCAGCWWASEVEILP